MPLLFSQFPQWVWKYFSKSVVFSFFKYHNQAAKTQEFAIFTWKHELESSCKHIRSPESVKKRRQSGWKSTTACFHSSQTGMDMSSYFCLILKPWQDRVIRRSFVNVFEMSEVWISFSWSLWRINAMLSITYFDTTTIWWPYILAKGHKKRPTMQSTEKEKFKKVEWAEGSAPMAATQKPNRRIRNKKGTTETWKPNLSWLTNALTSMCFRLEVSCLRTFFLTPSPKHCPIKHPHYRLVTSPKQKAAPRRSSPLPLFSPWLWLSCSPSVMVIYISENNKVEAVEPRDTGEDHRCPSYHPLPCHSHFSLLLGGDKGV